MLIYIWLAIGEYFLGEFFDLQISFPLHFCTGVPRSPIPEKFSPRSHVSEKIIPGPTNDESEHKQEKRWDSFEDT